MWADTCYYLTIYLSIYHPKHPIISIIIILLWILPNLSPLPTNHDDDDDDDHHHLFSSMNNNNNVRLYVCLCCYSIFRQSDFFSHSSIVWKKEREREIEIKKLNKNLDRWIYYIIIIIYYICYDDDYIIGCHWSPLNEWLIDD